LYISTHTFAGCTPKDTPKGPAKNIYDGWLIKEKELYARRGTGEYMPVSAIKRQDGTIELLINNSKGCDRVMRVALVGLFCRKEEAFQIASKCVALMCSHLSGYLFAGGHVHIITCIKEGPDI